MDVSTARIFVQKVIADCVKGSMVLRGNGFKRIATIARRCAETQSVAEVKRKDVYCIVNEWIIIRNEACTDSVGEVPRESLYGPHTTHM